MKIVASTGKSDIATVYVAETDSGRLIEFVESVQPPIPRHEKWVIIVSTLYGCPVRCRFCDAGHEYAGRLSRDDIVSQIDFLIGNRFGGRAVPVRKFKIQFARMGEPAFNPAVLDVLDELPNLYNAPGLLPSLSTVAPAGTDGFFKRLLVIKRENYRRRFQLQFSIHTTDPEKRDWLIPTKKWNFARVAEYGDRFHEDGWRKIALNFALADGLPVDPAVLLGFFDPRRFIIKITPVNPTHQSTKNNLASAIQHNDHHNRKVNELREAGYDVIVSIGESEENFIGSNCGQYIINYLAAKTELPGAYTYELRPNPAIPTTDTQSDRIM